MNTGTTRRSILAGVGAIASLLGVTRLAAAPTDDDIAEMVQKLAVMMEARAGGSWRSMVDHSVGVIVISRKGGAA